MKRIKIMISVVGLALAALGAGFWTFYQGAGKETEYLSASWNYNYRDIEEISQASDLIALVKIEDVENMVVENGVPFTIYSAEVITPIYNTTESGNLLIYMTGGETDEKIIEIIDDPLLQADDEILVFCKLSPDGTYQIISGPQGRLVYHDGKLNSLNAVNTRVAQANTFSNIRVQNADADELIDEIKGYVEAK